MGNKNVSLEPTQRSPQRYRRTGIEHPEEASSPRHIQSQVRSEGFVRGEQGHENMAGSAAVETVSDRPGVGLRPSRRIVRQQVHHQRTRVALLFMLPDGSFLPTSRGPLAPHDVSLAMAGENPATVTSEYEPQVRRPNPLEITTARIPSLRADGRQDKNIIKRPCVSNNATRRGPVNA